MYILCGTGRPLWKGRPLWDETWGETLVHVFIALGLTLTWLHQVHIFIFILGII